MALDRSVIADADVAAAIAAIVDGQAPDSVEELLRHRRRARIERHAAAADVWNGAAEIAPAMGMVGTLIGLVGMFVKMQDPDAIGASMAVALLATLYGALLANLVAMPVAIRLRRQGRDEAVERLRLVAPLIALAERERPRAAAIVPIGERRMTVDEFPESPSGRPIWLMTLADLALLLVGFFVFIQASRHLDNQALARGIREGFGAQARVRRRPSAIRCRSPPPACSISQPDRPRSPPRRRA